MASNADAVKRYQSKMDTMLIHADMGTKDRWRLAAQASGVSLQRYIIDSVEMRIKSDLAKDEVNQR